MTGISDCPPTATPDDIDLPALREKYRQERDKRLRPEGSCSVTTNHIAMYRYWRN